MNKYWEAWKNVIKQDFLYIITILLVLGAFLYAANEVANDEINCMEKMEALGCYELKYSYDGLPLADDYVKMIKDSENGMARNNKIEME